MYRPGFGIIRSHNFPHWQSYCATIIGTRPTIVVISRSRCANSDVWHATDRRSWEAPHSISHSVTRITSHLPIRLPPGELSDDPRRISSSARRRGRHEFGLPANSWFKLFANDDATGCLPRARLTYRQGGSHEAVTQQNGFSSRVRTLAVLSLHHASSAELR